MRTTHTRAARRIIQDNEDPAPKNEATLYVGNGWRVCSSTIEPNRDETNTRLIAAAPKMVKLVQELADCTDILFEMSSDEELARDLKVLAKRARVVIAQAIAEK